MNFAGFAQNYTPKPFDLFTLTTGGAALTCGYKYLSPSTDLLLYYDRNLQLKHKDNAGLYTELTINDLLKTTF